MYNKKLINLKLTLDGKEISFSEYENKVLLIVNTGSKCLFAKQLTGLADLKKEINNPNFEILAFPTRNFGGQELKDNETIKTVCSTKFNTNFPILDLINIKEDKLFEVLKAETNTKRILWNFEKFLVSKDGEVVQHYYSTTKPLTLVERINSLLK